MASLGNTNPTLLDLALRSDSSGKIATIAEILNATNEILDDMTWQEGNLPTGHRFVMRTGLPTVTWRRLYEFVQPSKSTTVQVTNSTGMLEAYAEIDKALADLNGNTSAFRLSEDKAFIESMSQEMAQTLFYGNETAVPQSFTGISPYYNDSTAANGENIIKAGGAGNDNASIWLIVWSPETVFGIVPKGSTAGLQTEDKGQVTIQDTTGGRMEAYRSHYRWDAGLCLRDWRYVVRICNIDKSALSNLYTPGTGFSAGADLGDLMFQAMRRIPNLNMGRPVFYASRDIATWISRQTAAKGLGGSALSADQLSGDKRWTERFMGIPVRRCDVLAADEALVS